MTREAEVVYDDRIGRWRVDLYEYDGDNWILDKPVGTFQTKAEARKAAEAVAQNESVYLEKRDGSFQKRYPA